MVLKSKVSGDQAAEQLANIERLHLSNGIKLQIKEELLKELGIENRELRTTPRSVLERTIRDFQGDPTGLKREILKFSAIQILVVSKLDGNTVEIGDKIFSTLRPAVDDKNVFAWPKWYEHVRYIKWSSVNSEVKKAGKKLFKNIDEAKNFINTYIPGATETTRIQNFVELIGLDLSGSRVPSGHFSSLSERGYAWLTKHGVSLTWECGPSDFNDGRLTYMANLDDAMPAVCFE